MRSIGERTPGIAPSRYSTRNPSTPTWAKSRTHHGLFPLPPTWFVMLPGHGLIAPHEMRRDQRMGEPAHPILRRAEEIRDLHGQGVWIRHVQRRGRIGQRKRALYGELHVVADDREHAQRELPEGIRLVDG